jgi:gamma-glutamylcyclotransferase (GGCT)/AIG2-like uncharacterized protein YtfP
MLAATLPPPPPPPPALRNLAKPSPLTSNIPPPPPVPLNAFEPMDKAQYLESLIKTKVNIPGFPFQPYFMFFYGSLLDPEVLQTVLRLPDLPIMKPATIRGFRMKMWGIYPTILPTASKNESVKGMVWEVTDENYFDRLAAYETVAYRVSECEAALEDGEIVENCWTFCWAGKADSQELVDGEFDLEKWKRDLKHLVIRQ